MAKIPPPPPRYTLKSPKKRFNELRAQINAISEEAQNVDRKSSEILLRDKKPLKQLHEVSLSPSPSDKRSSDSLIVARAQVFQGLFVFLFAVSIVVVPIVTTELPPPTYFLAYATYICHACGWSIFLAPSFGVIEHQLSVVICLAASLINLGRLDASSKSISCVPFVFAFVESILARFTSHRDEELAIGGPQSEVNQTSTMQAWMRCQTIEQPRRLIALILTFICAFAGFGFAAVLSGPEQAFLEALFPGLVLFSILAILTPKPADGLPDKFACTFALLAAIQLLVFGKQATVIAVLPSIILTVIVYHMPCFSATSWMLPALGTVRPIFLWQRTTEMLRSYKRKLVVRAVATVAFVAVASSILGWNTIQTIHIGISSEAATFMVNAINQTAPMAPFMATNEGKLIIDLLPALAKHIRVALDAIYTALPILVRFGQESSLNWSPLHSPLQIVCLAVLAAYSMCSLARDVPAFLPALAFAASAAALSDACMTWGTAQNALSCILLNPQPGCSREFSGRGVLWIAGLVVLSVAACIDMGLSSSANKNRRNNDDATDSQQTSQKQEVGRMRAFKAGVCYKPEKFPLILQVIASILMLVGVAMVSQGAAPSVNMACPGKTNTYEVDHQMVEINRDLSTFPVGLSKVIKGQWILVLALLKYGVSSIPQVEDCPIDDALSDAGEFFEDGFQEISNTFSFGRRQLGSEHRELGVSELEAHIVRQLNICNLPADVLGNIADLLGKIDSLASPLIDSATEFFNNQYNNDELTNFFQSMKDLTEGLNRLKLNSFLDFYDFGLGDLFPDVDFSISLSQTLLVVIYILLGVWFLLSLVGIWVPRALVLTDAVAKYFLTLACTALYDLLSLQKELHEVGCTMYMDIRFGLLLFAIGVCLTFASTLLRPALTLIAVKGSRLLNSIITLTTKAKGASPGPGPRYDWVPTKQNECPPDACVTVKVDI